MTDLRIYADKDELARAAADAIAATLRTAVSGTGAASLVLAGGTTPEKIYRLLAHLDVPWAQVSLYFGDERAVGPDDDDSNYKMVQTCLLAGLPTAPKHVERMQGEAADLEAEARRYEAALPDRVTLLLLGVGEDGHVASIFPGHPEAVETARSVVVVQDSPKPPPLRLTITPAVIARAQHVFVLAAGDGKRDALHHALGSPDSSLPVALARRGTFFLDAAAASRLQPEGTNA